MIFPNRVGCRDPAFFATPARSAIVRHRSHRGDLDGRFGVERPIRVRVVRRLLPGSEPAGTPRTILSRSRQDRDMRGVRFSRARITRARALRSSTHTAHDRPEHVRRHVLRAERDAVRARRRPGRAPSAAPPDRTVVVRPRSPPRPRGIVSSLPRRPWESPRPRAGPPGSARTRETLARSPHPEATPPRGGRHAALPPRPGAAPTPSPSPPPQQRPDPSPPPSLLPPASSSSSSSPRSTPAGVLSGRKDYLKGKALSTRAARAPSRRQGLTTTRDRRERG